MSSNLPGGVLAHDASQQHCEVTKVHCIFLTKVNSELGIGDRAPIKVGVGPVLFSAQDVKQVIAELFWREFSKHHYSDRKDLGLPACVDCTSLSTVILY